MVEGAKKVEPLGATTGLARVMRDALVATVVSLIVGFAANLVHPRKIQ